MSKEENVIILRPHTLGRMKNLQHMALSKDAQTVLVKFHMVPYLLPYVSIWCLKQVLYEFHMVFHTATI